MLPWEWRICLFYCAIHHCAIIRPEAAANRIAESGWLKWCYCGLSFSEESSQPCIWARMVLEKSFSVDCSKEIFPKHLSIPFWWYVGDNVFYIHASAITAFLCVSERWISCFTLPTVMRRKINDISRETWAVLSGRQSPLKAAKPSFQTLDLSLHLVRTLHRAGEGGVSRSDSPKSSWQSLPQEWEVETALQLSAPVPA